jgi:DNA-binding transcriptional ArsR family regulator
LARAGRDSGPGAKRHHQLKISLELYIYQDIYWRMDAFEAIAEPNRRNILDLLRAGERPAGELVQALAISQPGVSKHLRLLREAGLVRVRADGQRRLYSLDPASLAPLEVWLAPYRAFWRGRLDALEEHLDKEQ